MIYTYAVMSGGTYRQRTHSTILYIQTHHPLFSHYKNIIQSADRSADRADYQCRSRRRQHTAATMGNIQRQQCHYVFRDNT